MNARTDPGAALAAALPPLGQPGRRVAVEDLLPALVADGLLAPADAEAVARYARLSSADQHALVALARRKLKSPDGHRLLDLDVLCPWFAQRVGLPYVHIDPLKVDLSRVAEVMSSQYATRFRILPLEVKAGEITIATAEPFVTDWVDELRSLLRREIRRVIANPQDIAHYTVEFFTLARTVRGAQKNGQVAHQNNFEQLVELGRSGRSLDANDQHVVTIVDWLWQYAFEQRASDIHMEPRRDAGTIRFRIDGVLHNVYQVPASVFAAMTSRIKLLGRMDVIEKRRPQDGRIKTRNADGREIELRLSTLPTAFGEKLVMRVFDPEVLVRDFAELGLHDHDLETWESMTARPNGIVLVTGPTGSGKTTTLYSTLRQLATDEVNVCTVEDPIEMVEPRFNQMQVQHGIELGFADGIRALMRQDPDIIMVGEIRDLQTAEMAVQAALTGHLVLSTLHTNSAPESITRLLEMGLDPFMFSDSLLAILAQRLVRRLCPHCRVAEPMHAEALRALAEEYRASAIGNGGSRGSHGPGVDEIVARWQDDYGIREGADAGRVRTWRHQGCVHCDHHGYRGRLGLHELMRADEPLRESIRRRAPASELQAGALQAGMRTLRQDGIEKMLQGLTDLPEVIAASNQ